MDIGALLKAKEAWNKFNNNHPKFYPFITAVKNRGVVEGTIIEMEVKYPNDGGNMKTNIKVTQSDLELLQMLMSVLGK